MLTSNAPETTTLMPASAMALIWASSKSSSPLLKSFSSFADLSSTVPWGKKKKKKKKKKKET